MSELASTFASGFSHPLHGADHVVAMLAVGVWGALAGGRAIRAWPVAFVAAMLAGFAIAASGVGIPFVEPAIWSSVVVLGLVVALAVNARLWLGAAIIGLFAFFHGHVHGTETASSNLVAYAVGLAAATGALHAAGIGLCRAANSSSGRVAVRSMGAAAALGGIMAMAVLA